MSFDAESGVAANDERQIDGDESLTWHRFSRLEFVRAAGIVWLLPIMLVAAEFRRLMRDDGLGFNESLITIFVHSGRFYLLAIAALFALTLGSLGLQYLTWRYSAYALGSRAVHMRTGWLERKQESLPYGRIQTVETKRTLTDRLLGLGTLEVDTGADASEAMKLGRLRIGECVRVRRVILEASAAARRGEVARVAAGVSATGDVSPDARTADDVSLDGIAEAEGETVTDAHLAEASLASREATTVVADLSDGATAATGADIAEEPGERLIYRIRPRDLLLSRLLSGTTGAALLSAVFGAVALFLDGGITVVALIFAFIGTASSAYKSLAQAWDTRLSVAPSGVRLRAGLTTTTTRTITPARVHLIEIKQGLLMRMLGVYSLSVTYPGFDSDDGEVSLTIVPLGKRSDIEWVLWVFAHNLGVPVPSDLVEQFLGERAQLQREGVAAVEGVQWCGLTSERMRFLRPWSWRWGALVYTEEVAMRRRRTPLTTQWSILLHEHWQSLSWGAGPIARRIDTANISFDLVRGVFAHSGLTRDDCEVAVGLAQELADVARASGQDETIDMWRERVGVAV